MALWGFVQISKFYRVTVSPYSTHHHRNISSQRGQDVLFLGCRRISQPDFQTLKVTRGHALSPFSFKQQRRLRNSLGPAYSVGKKDKNGVKQQKISASEASLDTSRGLLRSLIIFFALPDFFLLFPSMRSLVASKLRKRHLKKVFALL